MGVGVDRCVALFEQGADGTRLLGRSRDPELVELVAECLAAGKRAELEDLKAAAPLGAPRQRASGDEE
jgi:hypothetical protein